MCVRREMKKEGERETEKVAPRRHDASLLASLFSQVCYDRTNTLLSLLSALLSAAVLFFASLSGARSRGNLVAVFGLRLPERLLFWLSLSWLSPFSNEPSVGSGRCAVGPFDSGARESDLSEGSGVGGLFVFPAAAAPLMAGSCGPCSGMACAGAGGGATTLPR